MDERATQGPWELLSQIIAGGDRNHLASYLDTLSSKEKARAISRLAPEDQSRLMLALDPPAAAVIVHEVPPTQAVHLIAGLPADAAAAILGEVRSDRQVDLLAQLGPEGAEGVIARMESSMAARVRRLLTYPAESAGGIMITEYLAYPGDWLAQELVADLESHRGDYADISVQYMYVVDSAGRLEGVLRMRDLVFSPKTVRIADTMITDPLMVRAEQTLEELQQFFERHPLLGVPVVDSDRRLLGIVRRVDVDHAAARRVNRQFLGLSGIVGGEEFRTMPFVTRSGRRLSWLTLNIVLNIIAASVIAFYQDTLAAVIALAVFLPMISDMSGCSGNQAVAVSMRELALGLVRPNELVRVLGKEIAVGTLNGAVLGVLLGGVALLWKGNIYLGLVVGAALAVNTVVAVCLGGLLPMVLKRLRLDPALVSGPVLTTVTDMCGFVLVLSLASALLPRLAG